MCLRHLSFLKDTGTISTIPAVTSTTYTFGHAVTDVCSGELIEVHASGLPHCPAWPLEQKIARSVDAALAADLEQRQCAASDAGAPDPALVADLKSTATNLIIEAGLHPPNKRYGAQGPRTMLTEASGEHRLSALLTHIRPKPKPSRGTEV
eukprot:COSAG02_NODE_12329_length_1561_cov_2.823529_1_plen_150_part_10